VCGGVRTWCGIGKAVVCLMSNEERLAELEEQMTKQAEWVADVLADQLRPVAAALFNAHGAGITREKAKDVLIGVAWPLVREQAVLLLKDFGFAEADAHEVAWGGPYVAHELDEAYMGTVDRVMLETELLHGLPDTAAVN
jgi:hypothetical protein